MSPCSPHPALASSPVPHNHSQVPPCAINSAAHSSGGRRWVGASLNRRMSLSGASCSLAWQEDNLVRRRSGKVPDFYNGGLQSPHNSSGAAFTNPVPQADTLAQDWGWQGWKWGGCWPGRVSWASTKQHLSLLEVFIPAHFSPSDTCPVSQLLKAALINGAIKWSFKGPWARPRL